MSFSESVRTVLGASTPDRQLRSELQGLGVAPTVLNSIHWAMSGKAAKGDPSAAKYLRDTLEEEPELPAPATGERADLSALTDGELLAMVRQSGRRTP